MRRFGGFPSAICAALRHDQWLCRPRGAPDPIRAERSEIGCHTLGDGVLPIIMPDVSEPPKNGPWSPDPPPSPEPKDEQK
jgi:hypothetical protein